MDTPAGSLIREHFRNQARACADLGSPFTALLCQTLAEHLDPRTHVGSHILNWPGDPSADALALRVCGALHSLVLAGTDAELAAVYPPAATEAGAMAAVLTAALARHEDYIIAFLASPPQTNEVARSAMLLPGFLAIARATGLPLALNEIGASAGLDLLFDKFHYRYATREWGDGASPVQLAPEIPLDGELHVTSRRGCDVAPVDLNSDHARLRLTSYVWPDQRYRHERLAGALELASQAELRVEKGSASDFVRQALSRRSPGRVPVFYHSIVWQYISPSERGAIEAGLEDAGRAADMPLAWLRMEPLKVGDPFATLSLTLWPEGETRHLAKCDYHGRWIEWIA